MDWTGITHCQLVLSACWLFVKQSERPPFSPQLMRADPLSEHMGILTELMWSRENLGKSPAEKTKLVLPHLKELKTVVAAINNEEFTDFKKQMLARFDEVLANLETVKLETVKP